MTLRDWLQPPRRLIALFLLVTLVPSVALVVSGWRLLEQERRLSLSELSERREQAADLAVSQLTPLVAAARQAIPDEASLQIMAGRDDDAVGVIFTNDRVEAFPDRRLPFYPRTEAGPEAPANRFADGEQYEFGQQAVSVATQTYRGLARSLNLALRAGALIRLARVLRNSNEIERALDVYAEIGRLSGVAVSGVPADLLARWARCELLESLGRRDMLQTEARALQADLDRGRWHLDRATYDLHIEEVRRWTESAIIVVEGKQVLAAAVEILWNEWQHSPDRFDGSGQRVIDTSNRRITVMWAVRRERLSALLVGPAFVERQWLARIKPALDLQHVRLEFGAPAHDARPQARRAAADTGLPWTLLFDVVDARGELNRIESRGKLWLWGLLLMAGVAAGGIAIIARSITRDLAVARLQSDFVSAVSHEFRTPLTSLRQISEVLLDNRIAAADRRETYYRALARQTERLHRLVESLLDFGRMEAGTSPYRLELVDARTLIGAVVDEFKQDSAGRGYHLDLQVAGLRDAAPTIRADREALTHAVWNLLDNAVKYSPECRSVWVELDRLGSQLAIRVRDHGLGVQRHEHADIFRRFVRGADAKTRGIKGTGIGLAMVRHIVSAHGGQIQVDSAPAEGSTFTITIPATFDDSDARDRFVCRTS